MSMYEMIFGDGQAGTAVLAALGFKVTGDVGRYRSAWVERAEDGSLRAAVYTRNGGGNRNCWEERSAKDCSCPGCIQERVLPAHPLYLFDRDDDFDATYCTTYFSLPPEIVEAIERAASESGEEVQGPVNMSDVWQGAINAIASKEPSP